MSDIVHFLSRHGYAVLFLAVLAEQVGLPIPSGVVLIAAGSLAGSGAMSLWSALGLALTASLMGDFFWFMLGKWRGRSVLATLCRISLEPDTCVRQTESMFTKHRLKSLLFSKFVPGLGTVAPPMAAILNVGLGAFLFFDALGAIIWASAYLLGGFFFRREIEQVAIYTRMTGTSLVEIAIALACLYIAMKFIARRKFYNEIRMARITPKDLMTLIGSGETTTIIDLRHAHEWEDGNIPGALLMTDNELDAMFPSEPRGEVILYCS
jgi:membrane protein DedA with SNARE-associated domain